MNLQRKIKNKQATTAQQFKVLITEMEKLPLLGEDFPNDTENRIKMEKVWILISNKLNEVGPPYRKPRNWRKVWTDLRGRTRKKIEVARLPDSHDFKFCLNNLTSIEKEVDRIYQYSQGLDPIADQMSYLANDIKIEPEDEDELRDFITSVEGTSALPVKLPTLSTAVPNVVTHSLGKPAVSQLSINLNHKRLPRKRTCVEQQTDLLKQQLKKQKKLLKFSKEQKNIAEQQIAIFSKISQTMVRQAKAVEEQTNAFEGFLQLLKERLL